MKPTEKFWAIYCRDSQRKWHVWTEGGYPRTFLTREAARYYRAIAIPHSPLKIARFEFKSWETCR